MPRTSRLLYAASRLRRPNPGPSVDMPTVGSPVPAKQGLSTPSLILSVFDCLYQASDMLAIAQLTGKRSAPRRNDC